MNTCDTCIWWNIQPSYHLDEYEIHRECLNKKIQYDSNEWVKSNDGAMQWGNDAGYVTFATAPKFGCILHQSR